MGRFRRKISKKCSRMRVQRLGDSAEHCDRWIAISALDRPEIPQVQAGAQRELLLRHSASLSHLADRSANDAFPSHNRIGASVVMQGLGHICPLSVPVGELHV